MIQLRLILLFVISILLRFQTDIKAQELDTTASEINIKNLRLPLPVYAKKSARYSINDEIANLIADILEQIEVHDVFVGIELDSTFINNDSTTKNHSIVTLKELNGYIEPPCPFLEKNACKIYPARPLVCRIYPFLLLNEGQLTLS